MRCAPPVCVPYVPLPQTFWPRERYQKHTPAVGSATSVSVVDARLLKQTSSLPPGPTGSAAVRPRRPSYCVDPEAADQLNVVLLAAATRFCVSGGAVIPPPLQTPPAQTSPTVQAFPSSQAKVLFVKTHPVAGMQVSVVHTFPSLQTRVPAPGLQLPPPQVSPVVQAFPSLHETVLFVKTQPVAGTQVSVVHTLLSLQPSVPVPG